MLNFKTPYKTEIVIAISATQGFLNQIKLFYYSLHLIGMLDDSLRVNVIYSGSERKPLSTNTEHNNEIDADAHKRLNAFNEWLETKKDIRLIEVPKSFTSVQYPTPFAHCNFRFCVDLSPECEAVILCDADTIFLKPFSPLPLIHNHQEPAVAGHMVHFPPPCKFGDTQRHLNEADWIEYLNKLGLPTDQVKHHCSIAKDQCGLQPPNFNFGFVVISPQMYYLMSSNFNRYRKIITESMGSPMSGQIALTAIGLENDARFYLLPAQYNAANDSKHWATNNITKESVFVLHYLREEEFLRENFLSTEKITWFMNEKFTNEGTQLLQQNVKKIVQRYGTTVFTD